MNYREATLVIKILIDGREPESGQLLPAGSVVHRADVLRALLTAVTALEQAEARVQRRALLPDNVGRTWSAEEERKMLEAFRAGESPEQIARKHGRTLRAIEARLQRKGLITAKERITRGGFPSPE